MEVKLPSVKKAEQMGGQAVVLVHWYARTHGHDWYATGYDPDHMIFCGVTIGEWGAMVGTWEAAEVSGALQDLHWQPITLQEVLDLPHLPRAWGR